jgi:hypothetical protein
VLTFWPYVWQLDPGHTYDEHLVLALKTGCDTSRPLNSTQITSITYLFTPKPSTHFVFTICPEPFQNSSFALRTPFIHIFSTVTPNQVILVPKLSESHPLSPQAIHTIMIVAFVWFHAWALGESFQSRCMKISKIKRTKTFKTKYTRISRPII